MIITRHNLQAILQRLIGLGLAVVLLLMPFHAFFSIYLGSMGASQTIIQSWKEAFVIVLGVLWIIFILSKRRLNIKLDTTNIVFMLIVFLSILVTIFVRPESEAVLFGIKTNLVAIALYFIAQITLSNRAFIKRNLMWIIIIPGLIVSVLAILQGLIIPPEFLEQLGYSATTIDPRQIVDGSLKFYRAFSTLGGPNQLGAYLVIPLVFCLSYAIVQKKWKLLLLALPVLMAIFLSYSRSAWLGSIVAIFAVLAIATNKKARIYFVVASIVLVFSAGALISTQIGKNTDIERVLLHGRYFENRIEGSDQNRLEAISTTTNSVMARPFGHGLGSAGPASFKSTHPVIIENWYLQIAYEIGLVGLLLYIIAFAGLLAGMLQDRNNPLAVSLFGATVGMLVMSLFLHTWADSTLVLIMFALYGLYKGRST